MLSAAMFTLTLHAWLPYLSSKPLMPVHLERFNTVPPSLIRVSVTECNAPTAMTGEGNFSVSLTTCTAKT